VAVHAGDLAHVRLLLGRDERDAAAERVRDRDHVAE
jgi:hypothetical protein